MKLFVYGTLKKGKGLNSLLDTSEFLGKGKVKGIMYVSNTFYIPFLTRGKGIVYGELYNVTDKEVIRTIRGIERAYNEESIEVTLEDGNRVKARAYFGRHMVEYIKLEGNYVIVKDF